MRNKRVQKVAGVVLLVILLLPVIVMSIPATYTEIEFRPNPTTGIIETVYIDHEYVPIIDLLRGVDGTPDDVAVLGIYTCLFALTVWLVVHSARRKPKEA